MNAEILAVGTEIILGDILNTNARYLSQRLSLEGINVFFHTACGDNPARLSSALDIALDRSDMVIMTGGLGPTYDDLTKETVAGKFGLPMELHQPSLERIEGFFTRMGRPMTDNNRKQAMMPRGALVFENQWGTAPACAIDEGGKIVIMLPGPPREMQPIFEASVLPYLRGMRLGTIVSSTMHVFGIGESALEDMLHPLLDGINPTVAPYAKPGEVHLRVTAKADSEAAAREMIAPVVAEIRGRLGDNVYSVDNLPGEQGGPLEQALVRLLQSRGLSVAVAESCTGGLVAGAITSVPGSSQVFGCGVVAYANEIKQALLGVSAETLASCGAVSERTAIEMARGVRRAAGASIGLSTTGIAGPDGGSEQKPVGLVYVGVSSAAGEYALRRVIGRGDAERDYVREVAVLTALDCARRLVLSGDLGEKS